MKKTQRVLSAEFPDLIWGIDQIRIFSKRARDRAGDCWRFGYEMQRLYVVDEATNVVTSCGEQANGNQLAYLIGAMVWFLEIDEGCV